MSEHTGVSINIKELTHRYNSKCPLTFDKVDIQAAIKKFLGNAELDIYMKKFKGNL